MCQVSANIFDMRQLYEDPFSDVGLFVFHDDSFLMRACMCFQIAWLFFHSSVFRVCSLSMRFNSFISEEGLQMVSPRHCCRVVSPRHPCCHMMISPRHMWLSPDCSFRLFIAFIFNSISLKLFLSNEDVMMINIQCSFRVPYCTC